VLAECPGAWLEAIMIAHGFPLDLRAGRSDPLIQIGLAVAHLRTPSVRRDWGIDQVGAEKTRARWIRQVQAM
jgi:hypothetical protein